MESTAFPIVLRSASFRNFMAGAIFSCPPELSSWPVPVDSFDDNYTRQPDCFHPNFRRNGFDYDWEWGKAPPPVKFKAVLRKVLVEQGTRAAP
eukprot:6544185-Karenia_brevis.AAC.1